MTIANIRKIRKIEQKVEKYYNYIGALSDFAYNLPEKMRVIHEGVIYYLQVGEDVLDKTFKEAIIHSEDWHLNQPKKWQKANCGKNCKHKSTDLE